MALLWFHDCKQRNAGLPGCAPSPQLLVKDNKILEFLKTDCESSRAKVTAPALVKYPRSGRLRLKNPGISIEARLMKKYRGRKSRDTATANFGLADISISDSAHC